MTDAAIIYRTHVEAIESLPPEEQLAAYKAIVAYCMDDRIPEDMIGRYTVQMAKPLLDKWKSKREAGAKGGSAKKQTEATDKQTEADGSNTEPKEKEKVIVKDKEKENKEREVRHKRGAFGHVLLTDEQYNGLVERFGEEKTKAGIKRVDEYCEETGKRYKNYALVIQRWGIPAARERPANKFQNFPQRNNKEHDDMVARIIAMQ